MLLNKITSEWIQAYIAHPKSALIIECEDELSLTPTATYIYDTLIGESQELLVKIHTEDKKSIGVNTIRRLKQQLSLQANTSTKAISRMIVIELAHTMTEEAQNALLKLIEELPKRTTICLTVVRASDLLATITSRCFMVRILPIEKKVAIEYALKNNVSAIDAAKYYAMSSGYAGLFESLVNNSSSDIVEAIAEAKIFLTSSVFERQKLVQNILKAPDSLADFLKAIRAIALAGLRSSHDSTKTLWKDILREVTITEKQLASNVSIKLVLLRLSVSL